MDAAGIDFQILSVDYPMDDNKAGADFLAAYPMDDQVRRKVASENAQRRFGDRIPSLG